jgi:hypothetical protein
MWQKLKEQVPAIILTAALVIGAAAYMIRHVVVQQRAELAPLRAQNEELRAQADENRRQIAATTKLLKDALAQQNGLSLQGDAQVEKINEERLTRLAEVIAQRVIPALPTPKSPEELQRAQSEQVDKVASQLAANIRPVLAEAIADQKAGAAQMVQQSEARVQQLNVGLLATQAAAQDALRLSRELAALYVDSYKDKGVLMRLFSLPANLVVDAANLNFVSADRAKTERELSTKVTEIENRLKEIRSLASASTN